MRSLVMKRTSVEQLLLSGIPPSPHLVSSILLVCLRGKVAFPADFHYLFTEVAIIPGPVFRRILKIR